SRLSLGGNSHLPHGQFIKEIFMQSRIQILHITHKDGIAKKSGNPYEMRFAQCIVHSVEASGEVVPLVGELMLPKEFNAMTPGDYLVDFKVMIDQNKRVGAVVSSMVPYPAKASPAPAPAPAPKAA
ncbi:hypothetical protein, partial [Pseudomonas sp.]|uniref:hypothetical protein n=1 Tax=Pseudomonas sp. TaxID=306 RepID=UPI002612094C